MTMSSALRLSLADRRLCRGEARDGDAERAAAHVVEADAVEEVDAHRIAAVLSADAELDLVARLAPTLLRDGDELAHALLIERRERALGEDALRDVHRQERLVRVVARDAERRLREVVGAEGEELGDLRELAGLH